MSDQETEACEALQTTFQETARWRRDKAKEFENDTRNLEAAELLEQLANSVEQTDRALLLKYQSAMNDDRVAFSLSELQSELLRAVGFRSWPETAAEIVEQITIRADELLAGFATEDDELKGGGH